MQYFKTAVLRLKAEQNGLVVYASAAIIKRKEPINRGPVGYGLSALRLCVWLFDNFRIELFYIYQNFLFTLGAIKREIFQYRISAQLNSGFIFANRTEQPFHFAHTHVIQSDTHLTISRASL